MCAVGILCAGAAVGWHVVRRKFHGEALARLIMENFNRNRRGRMEIDHVSWRPRAVLDYLSGEATPVTVKGLRLYDVRGKLVVDVPRATGRIYLEPLRRNVSLVVEELTVDGGTIHVEMFPRPENPEYTELGLVTLFNSATPSTSATPPKLPDDPFTIQVRRLNAKNIRVTADIPSADLDIQGISVRNGFLHYNSPSVKEPHKFHLQALPKAEKAWVKLLGQEMNFRQIEFTDGFMDPAEAWELRFAARAVEGDNTPVNARAHLGRHGLKVDVTARNPGALASRYIPLVDLEDGADSWGAVMIRGTLIKPRVWVQGGGLRFRPPTGALVENLQGGLFYQRNQTHGTVEFEDVKGTVSGAGFTFNGLWDLFTGNMTGRVAGSNLPVRPFVPEAHRDMAPETLDGTATFRWVYPYRNHIEFSWDTRGKGGLLPDMKFAGRLHYVDNQFRLLENRLLSGTTRLNASGGFDTLGNLDVKLEAQADNLNQILSRFGMPPMARNGTFSGTIRGDVRNPKVQGRVSAGRLKFQGVEASHASGFVVATREQVAVSGATVHVAGGRVRGSGSMRLGGKKPHVTAQAVAEGLDLGVLTKGNANGQVAGRLKVAGPMDRLSGNVEFNSPSVTVRDTTVTGLSGNLELNRGNITVSGISARVAGVQVTSTGTISVDQDLDLKLDFSNLPIAEFTDGLLAGFLSMNMRIRGKVRDPELEGNLDLKRTVFNGKPVPDSRMAFFKRNQHKVFEGNLFESIQAKGNYSIGGPAFVKADLDFAQLDPQMLMASRFLTDKGITTLVSGNGHIHVEAGKSPDAAITFSRIEAGIPVRRGRGEERGYRGQEGRRRGEGRRGGPRQRVETVRLEQPATVQFQEGNLTIPPMVFSGTNTHLQFSGGYGPLSKKMKLHGDLDLRLLRNLLPENLPRTDGMVVLDLVADLADPKNPVSGDIHLAGNRLTLDNDTQVTLQSGKIEFRDRVIHLHRVRIIHEEEELVANGKIFLYDDNRVSNMALSFEGAVAASALMAVMGDSLYSASGRAQVRLDVTGTPAEPKILGRALFQESVRLFMRNGREIHVAPGGLVAFAGNQVQLTQLRVFIEDGYIDLDGHFRWQENRPQDVQMSIKIRNLVERSAGTYEVEAMGDLNLYSQNQDLFLSGTVDMLNARYEKKYDVNLVDRLLTPSARTTEKSASFLERTPWLGGIRFDIAVLLAGDIEIDNNFAQTKLEGQVHVGGTLASPHIGGIVALNGGSFRIPMLRGNYEIKEGSVDFDRAKDTRHTRDEPYLDVLGEMLFVDRMDNEHVINLRITGFMSQLKLEWSSSSGMNSAQVLTLLMLNRTPDEVRRGAGGLPDLGGMLEGYVPLNLQLGLTSEAVQVFVDRRFLGEHVVLKGNVEVGFLGQQQQEAQLIFRLHDRVQVLSRVRRRITGDDSALQEEGSEVQTRMELKYKMEFKGSVRDMLGF